VLSPHPPLYCDPPALQLGTHPCVSHFPPPLTFHIVIEDTAFGLHSLVSIFPPVPCVILKVLNLLALLMPLPFSPSDFFCLLILRFSPASRSPVPFHLPWFHSQSIAISSKQSLPPPVFGPPPTLKPFFLPKLHCPHPPPPFPGSCLKSSVGEAPHGYVFFLVSFQSYIFFSSVFWFSLLWLAFLFPYIFWLPLPRICDIID